MLSVSGLVSTRNSILATLLNLLHNDHCVARMRKEISRDLGSRIPSDKNDLKTMTYCHAVVLETLRLSCVVPIVSHYWYLYYNTCNKSSNLEFIYCSAIGLPEMCIFTRVSI